MMKRTLHALVFVAAIAAPALAQNGHGISGGALLWLDVESGSSVPLAPLTAEFEGLSSTPFGYDYAITWMGDVFRVDPVTGRASHYMDTGLAYVSALAYDLAEHALFVTHKVTSGHMLTRIDLASNLSSALGVIGEQVVGMDVSLMGELFAWDVGTMPGEGAGLLVVDKLTGASRDVNPDYGGPVDAMWLACRGTRIYCGQSNAYEIDRNTGVTSYISTFALAELYTLDFEEPEIGTPYCGATPNSTGLPARLRALGQLGDPTFLTEQLPPASLAYVIAGPSQGFLPFAGGSQGYLCVVGEVHRLLDTADRVADGGFLVGRPLLSDLPAVAGSTWRFQTWYQEPSGASNFSTPIALVMP